MRRRAGAKRSKAFTLIETALATVIIGVGVLAMVEAHSAFMRVNDYSTSAATGVYLANEVRERMRVLPRHDPVTGLYFQTSGGSSTLSGWGRESGEVVPTDFDDCDDFDGVSFGDGGGFAGPIDSTGQVLLEVGPDGQPALDAEGARFSLRGWTQSVTVQKVDPQNFATVRASNYLRSASPPNDPGLAVDRFPLRVTVTVFYRSPTDTERREMAKVTWIVP
jgi:hypothetical protein